MLTGTILKKTQQTHDKDLILDSKETDSPKEVTATKKYLLEPLILVVEAPLITTIRIVEYGSLYATANIVNGRVERTTGVYTAIYVTRSAGGHNYKTER